MSDNLFWRNRIVESGAADPQELAKGYNPDNWRFHPQIQRDALEDALDSIGVLQPVLFNRLSGKVIDGHLRIELAILKGQPLIPVNYVELTDDEEALALATLDAITEQAEPIADKLAALLERTRAMTTDRPGLGAMLAALKERAGINGNGHGEATDVEPQIDKAAELQKVWGVQVGDVWELGQHRLVCGDCTDRAVVEAVMKGERAEACITDPPYGMKLDTDYTQMSDWFNKQEGGKYDGFRQKAAGSKSQSYKPVTGDDKPFDPGFIFEFWGYCQEIFLFGADYYIDSIPDKNNGGWLVWDKRLDEDLDRMFGSAFELCWSKQPHKRDIIRVRWVGYFGTEKQDTKSRIHPTQKPVEVIAWIMERYTQAGDLISDPYLGSGTTMVTAHQLNRRCRGIEIEPSYVAVTLQRMSNLGLTPKRIS